MPQWSTPIVLHQPHDALDLVGADLALVRAAERARDRAAHLDAVRVRRRDDRAKRSTLSAIEQLMFFWLKASVAAAKTTISSGHSARGAESAASRPFMFGISTE